MKLPDAKGAKAPKTTAERQSAFKARKAAQGLAEVRGIFASPEHSAMIKLYAEQLKSDCYS
jgi:hypothetical protein